MIRNYYTEAYKGGIVPSLVAGELIDGRTKADIPQGAWKEYNLFIGTSPAPFSGSGGGIATTGASDAAAAAQADLSLITANTIVVPGMLVYNSSQNNIYLGIVSTIAANDKDITMTPNIPIAIAVNDNLTFVYPAAPSLSVLTIDNTTVTITSPAEGFVLPLSVVQITATSNGLANIIALE